MKKKIIIILVSIIAITLGIALFMYFNYNSIKKGDILTDVSFKESIPNIKSNDTSCITLDNSTNHIMIMHMYNIEHKISFIVVTLYDSTNTKELAKYLHSSSDYTSNDNFLVFKKGWNEIKDKNGNMTCCPISDCPIDTLNGTVTYTSGNTSLFKKCLQGL